MRSNASTRVKRDGTLIDEQVNLGDLTFSGRANVSDRSEFSFPSYNYTFFQDDRAFVFGSFGLYGLDLKYTFEAEGELSFQGVPVAGDTFRLSCPCSNGQTQTFRRPQRDSSTSSSRSG